MLTNDTQQGHADMLDRFTGAFLGSMLGDAMGRPFEMISGRDSRLEVLLSRKLTQPGFWLYSDDTEMMIAVAHAITTTRGFDAMSLLESLAAHHDPGRGYGHGMNKLLENVKRGGAISAFESWKEGSRGSGGAVRVVPIACARHDDLEQLRAIADASAAISHAHEIGRSGAVLHALGIALALKRDRETFDARVFLSTLRAEFGSRSETLCAKLDLVADLLTNDAAVHVAAETIGCGVLAEEAVPFALFTFLRFAPDFERVVTQAVLAGGDTDTIAAMSGALCGALVGERALPEAWTERLERGGRGADHVRSLANATFRLWQSETAT